jgi:magnesium-transporting ATPase (P-type)
MNPLASLLIHRPPRARPLADPATAASWSVTPEQLQATLRSTASGLSQAEAEQRLRPYGPNSLQKRERPAAVGLLLGQFESPLVLIMLFAAVVSVVVGAWTDAGTVLAVVLASALLGFAQEYSASDAVQKLRSQVSIKSSVQRMAKRGVIVRRLNSIENLGSMDVPYLPVPAMYCLIPLPAPLMLTLLGLTGLYVVVTKVAKEWFYQRLANRMV